ncbi:MAG TPA: type VI secretion system tube protein TssD, partial [Hymenobacter sp.]
MASFSAELRVAGHAFPVLHCAYGVHQATHHRGRVSAKARREPVHLTLSVPEGDALLAWAADPHNRQAAHVVFRDARGGAPLETLALGAAYCVSYQEEFVSGSGNDGAYLCHLVLSDPDGFTIQAGGPAAAFVAPPAREHGVPGVAALLGTAIGGAMSVTRTLISASEVPPHLPAPVPNPSP